MKTSAKILLVACSALALSCCNGGKTSDNPSQYLTDPAKIDMVHSLKVLDQDRFLEMDYTMDYKLDEMIASNAGSFIDVMKFIADNLLDVAPEDIAALAPTPGCSAFAATDPASGDKYMGRNYDFCHVEKGEEVPITAIMVKTAPEGGKKSINMIDAYWFGGRKGFYNDGKTDLSMLIGAPYNVLDGMNEDGLAVGILHLKGNPTAQADPAKPTIWCNILMRLILDKASTVDEAIELAKGFNMNMVNPAEGNNHFFIADANGDYAILEYTYEPGEPDVDAATPNRILVMKGEDHSYVTNFYVDPDLAGNSFLGGKSEKNGMNRYLILKGNLWLRTYKLSYDQARDLLKSVAQDAKPEENTSHTQWSALYNLTRKTMDVSILQEFEKKFSFKID